MAVTNQDRVGKAKEHTWYARKVGIAHRSRTETARDNPPRPRGSDFLGSVYLTLSTEAKIQLKPVEPRNARVDFLGP